ncbi:hypothetical protein [Saccharibacillus brassicae]|uniref:Uncharacterized protein n=1 Tax=Saccharibacillus brassicae TaxID=2583377 RepID=A0A4Y6V428_SACBS|nr:hypothetical protein [Saccharibacillus brassicae]QDH23257.1 hypothetical protein FFV09_21765 [Saccharibacillus brassicae]
MDRLIQANVQGSKTLRLSERSAHTDLLFANTLNIEIVNVSCAETASFVNDLPEGSPIPGIEEEQNVVSVIYVYFPLGTGEAYLTTEEWASKMVAYAPYNWAVERAFDPAYGMYFKLYPLYAYDLAPRDKFYISIGSVIAFGELEKMVYTAVRFPAVAMYGGPEDAKRQAEGESVTAGGTDFLAFFKKRAPLHIPSFDCDRTRVAVGDTVTLRWAAAGDVERCVITPGDTVVDRVGSLEVQVFEDTPFRLYAFGEDRQVARTVTVYAETPAITRFVSDCPHNETKYGERVTLSYAATNGCDLYLNQGIGRVRGSSISVLPARPETVYTLSSMGAEGLIRQNLTITVTDYLNVQEFTYYRTGRSPDTYRYYLSWKVCNCTTIQLTTSDGQLRSSGQDAGSLQFSDPSQVPLTLTLYCTGTSGQILDQVYIV